MQNLEKSQPKKISNQTVASIIITIFFMIFITLLTVTYFSYKVDNVRNIQAYIISVTENKNQDERIVIEDSNGKKYIVYDIVANEINFDELKQIENNEVTLHTITDDSIIEVIGITSSSFNFDFNKGIELQQNDTMTGIITMSSLCALSIGYLIYTLIKTKKQNSKLVDILVKYKDMKVPTVYTKKYKRANFIFGIIDILVFLILLFFTNNFYIYCCYFALFSLLAVIFNYISLKIYRNKNIIYCKVLYNFKVIPIPNDNYNNFMDIANYLSLSFDKEEFIINLDAMILNEKIAFEQVGQKLLKFEDYKELQESVEFAKQMPKTIPYKDLNLYTRAIFRKNGTISIFASSNLEKSNKYGLKHDIVFEITPISHNYIKNYNIQVDGLDKVLANKVEYMKTYCKGNGNIIDFHD